MATNGSIYITDQDFQRLTSLISQMPSELTETLEQELGRAHILPQTEIPQNIVTMNSLIKFVDSNNHQESTLTLVYPQEANLAENKVSVLAPVGIALLGLSVGQSIDWKTPHGKTKNLRVTEVLYQPEASGHFNL